MRKILLTALMLLALACSSAGNTIEDALKSIAYLGGTDGHCSAFSVAPHKWMSAGHCTALTTPTIAGQPAKVVKSDVDGDMAIFEGPDAPVLRMTTREPRLGEKVFIGGFPLDYPGPLGLVFFGQVQAVRVNPAPEVFKDDVNLFDLGFGPGDSGAPIMRGDRVTGMLTAGRTFPGNSAASPTVKAMNNFLAGVVVED